MFFFDAFREDKRPAAERSSSLTVRTRTRGPKGLMYRTVCRGVFRRQLP